MAAFDKHGKPLVAGDEVLIRGRVAQVNPVGEVADLLVIAEAVILPGNVSPTQDSSFIYLDSRQVEKVELATPAVAGG